MVAICRLAMHRVSACARVGGQGEPIHKYCDPRSYQARAGDRELGCYRRFVQTDPGDLGEDREGVGK